MRLALKLATGAGKTTVMAMLIAWQTVNAVRRPGSAHFTRGFLIVAPGLTSRTGFACSSRTTRTATTTAANWCPATCSAISSAPRSSSPTTTPSNCASALELSKGGRALLQGRGDELNTSKPKAR